MRLNIQGREYRGMLEPGSERLARYVEWLRRSFASLGIAERGTPLVEEVLLAPEVFPGARRDLLPDLVVTWSGVPAAAHSHSDLIGELSATLASGDAAGTTGRPASPCSSSPVGSRTGRCPPGTSWTSPATCRPTSLGNAGEPSAEELFIA